MQHIGWALFVAVAANLDNLGVGITYGMRQIKISHTANGIIAAISFFVTWFSSQIGQSFSIYASPQIGAIVSAALLCSMGLWICLQPIIHAVKEKQPIMDLQLFGTKIYIGPVEILRHPEKVDLDASKDLCCREAFLLGFALSLNAIAGGFAVGTAGQSPLVESALISAFSLLTVSLGHYWGQKYASELLGNYATTVSGFLLMLIGVYQLAG
ncbi:manganese efflux pump [Propionispora hippei]|uniref:Putative sporulation protein YtaF n=1 Tax=Propionispora hippei DSM 15287 TaxID=1123003 RepID=A0A1M6DUS6_9FIRM|nr:manganese efflux pump [Propionispora hippei]SHI76972.1 putative sporulation protein YtaF [Propionispora hippei DSM 15287]